MAKKSVDVEPTPVKRSRKTEEPVCKTVTKKCNTDVAALESKTTRYKKHVPETLAKPAFNPLANIDDELDMIEKMYALCSNSLDLSETAMSTSMLTLDLILSKGLRPGWYMFVGGEQSCKSTCANTLMVSAVEQSVPITEMWDYEGCCSLSTVLKTNFGEISFDELLKHLGINEIQEDKSFIDVDGLEVETLGRMVKVDKLYFSGIRPVTNITTDSGRSFSGYAHPMMCVSEGGDLVYRNIEQLRPGDKVVTRSFS